MKNTEENVDDSISRLINIIETPQASIPVQPLPSKKLVKTSVKNEKILELKDEYKPEASAARKAAAARGGIVSQRYTQMRQKRGYQKFSQKDHQLSESSATDNEDEPIAQPKGRGQAAAAKQAQQPSKRRKIDNA